MKLKIKFILSAFVALAFSVTSMAQITTSSLGGQITETSGIPAVGVAVVATHQPSGTVYGAVTNAEGRYAIQGMRVGGPYSVEISCLGFQTVTYTEITLQLGEQYALNASIQESSELLAEALVIASPASKFATEKTGAATNISRQQMESLPTISRSITDIAKLSPYGGNGMSFVGSDGRTANFTVDGANFNNNFGLSSSLPGGGSPISIDAIEEVQVVISPYDVRQTNFIGGGLNAITKSGTNTFKGSAYAYHRNENMRGNAIDGKEISGAREKDRTTTYGFTLGGPIVKNKLFFFVNYEYQQSPTIANRWRASVDGVADPDNYISRTTEADMKRVSDFLKTKYDYDTGSYTNFPADQSNMKILARIDWNISQKHKLALRYNYTLNQRWNPTNASSSDCGQRTTQARFSQYSMAFANSMYSMDNKVNTFSLDLNSRFTDN
ncbi:MAG: TonB-dependent receptor, partial [Bacteroidales bacterium]|nr:TonB-dependent receptor [Bacteroidales bacterium]